MAKTRTSSGADRIHPAGMSGPHHRMRIKDRYAALCKAILPITSVPGTHLALWPKMLPESRAVEKPERGRIVAIPQVGGSSPSLPAPGGLVRQGRRGSWFFRPCALVLRTKEFA